MIPPKWKKALVTFIICVVCAVGFVLIWDLAQTSSIQSSDGSQFAPKDVPAFLININSSDIISDYTKSNYEVYTLGKGAGSVRPAFEGLLDIKIKQSEAKNASKPNVYGLETKDKDDNEIDVPILDFPSDSDWLLIGPMDSHMLMQEMVAYDLYRQVGHYAPRGRFVKLYLGDDMSAKNFQGIYMFTERIKQNRNRLDIEVVGENEIEGEYILEMTPQSNRANATFSTYRNTYFITRDPKDDQLKKEQKEYLINYMNEFEKVLYGWNFDDPEEGYRQYIDVDKWIDFIIFNELFQNNDAFYSNTYMYLDQEGKIALGPLWDINSDMEDVNFDNARSHKGWYVVNAEWVERLFRDEYFVKRFRKRWKKLRNNQLREEYIETTFNFYKSYISEDEEILGDDGQLEEWLQNRAKWIDSNISYLSNKFAEDNLPIVALRKVGRVSDNRSEFADMTVSVLNDKQRKQVWANDGYKDINKYLKNAPRYLKTNVGIKLRGQSSSFFPKKQYNVETQDKEGNQINVGLLDFPVESDWVLYGPYSDKSLVRNVLAFELSNQIGRYAPKTQFVELFMSSDEEIQADDYRGVYVIMEKIKRGQRRVDISKLGSAQNKDGANNTKNGSETKSIMADNPVPFLVELSDVTKKDLTGNDVLYTDMSLGTREEYKYVFVFGYPKEDMLDEKSHESVREYVNTVEQVLYSYSDKQLYDNLQKYIDIDSFVDYFILNEILKNPDAFWASDFFYKDLNDKMFAGPLWDFNVSMGNIDFIDNKSTGWLIRYRKWARRLMQNKYFLNRCYSRIRELIRKTFHEKNINYLIESYEDKLSKAQRRNFDRWNVMGRQIWPNPTPVSQSYTEEMDNLQNWLNRRVSWFAGQVGGV